MIVSAVSAVTGQNLRAQNPNYGSMGLNKVDFTVDTFNKVNALQVLPDKNKNNVFDSINQWKAFCHRQILGGKLDVIA